MNHVVSQQYSQPSVHEAVVVMFAVSVVNLLTIVLKWNVMTRYDVEEKRNKQKSFTHGDHFNVTPPLMNCRIHVLPYKVMYMYCTLCTSITTIFKCMIGLRKIGSFASAPTEITLHCRLQKYSIENNVTNIPSFQRSVESITVQQKHKPDQVRTVQSPHTSVQLGYYALATGFYQWFLAYMYIKKRHNVHKTLFLYL